MTEDAPHIELTRSDGGWTRGLPHNCVGSSNGASLPGGTSINDSVYGTAKMGDTHGQGVVFKIEPWIKGCLR